MNYYSTNKKNEITLFGATWIDLEIGILSEVKSDKEGQISCDIPYRWNLKRNDTHKLIYKTSLKLKE